MPLDNMIGADNETLVEGLSEHLSRVARWVNRGHPSMWTAPYVSVLNADLPNASDAAGAFGANRVLTGDVQRFEDGYRMNLRFIDTRSGKDFVLWRYATASRTHALLMPSSTTAILIAVCSRMQKHRGSAGNPRRRRLPEGNALLRRTDDSKALASALTILDRGAALDPSFALLACIDGNARYQMYRRSRDPATLAASLEMARAALSASPGLTEAAVLMGEIYSRMELPDSAEAWYRRAVAVEPAYLQASQRLASLYDGQKRLDEAERVHLNFIAIHPDLWVARRGLGTFYFEHERIDEAAGLPGGAHACPARFQGIEQPWGGPSSRAMGNGARVVAAFQTRPDCESSSNVAITLCSSASTTSRRNTTSLHWNTATRPSTCHGATWRAHCTGRREAVIERPSTSARRWPSHAPSSRNGPTMST
jgi:tetratricopeptide (TPR) repeat protein